MEKPKEEIFYCGIWGLGVCLVFVLALFARNG